MTNQDSIQQKHLEAIWKQCTEETFTVGVMRDDWQDFHYRYASDKFKLDADLFEVRNGGLMKIGGNGRLEFNEVEILDESAATSCTTVTADAIKDYEEWRKSLQTEFMKCDKSFRSMYFIEDTKTWHKRDELPELFLNQKAKI
jgi:hypothetical protein